MAFMSAGASVGRKHLLIRQNQLNLYTKTSSLFNSRATPRRTVNPTSAAASAVDAEHAKAAQHAAEKPPIPSVTADPPATNPETHADVRGEGNIPAEKLTEGINGETYYLHHTHTSETVSNLPRAKIPRSVAGESNPTAEGEVAPLGDTDVEGTPEHAKIAQHNAEKEPIPRVTADPPVVNPETHADVKGEGNIPSEKLTEGINGELYYLHHNKASETVSNLPRAKIPRHTQGEASRMPEGEVAPLPSVQRDMVRDVEEKVVEGEKEEEQLERLGGMVFMSRRARGLAKPIKKPGGRDAEGKRPADQGPIDAVNMIQRGEKAEVNMQQGQVDNVGVEVPKATEEQFAKKAETVKLSAAPELPRNAGPTADLNTTPRVAETPKIEQKDVSAEEIAKEAEEITQGKVSKDEIERLAVEIEMDIKKAEHIPVSVRPLISFPLIYSYTDPKR